jgi:NTE family protein
MKKVFFVLLVWISNIATAQIKHANNRILVVGGGGARGAWGAGLASSLIKKRNENYKVIIGTSTGSLMAPLLALGQLDKLKEAYTSVTQKSIFNINPFKKDPKKLKLRFLNLILRLGKQSIGRTENLKTTIKKFLDKASYAKLVENSSSSKILATVVDLKTGKVTYPESGKNMLYEDMVNWIWASANEPVYMSYFTNNKTGYFVDGGVRENVPLEKAITIANDTAYFKNVDSIFIDVIVNKPFNIIVDTLYNPNTFFKSLTRTIELFEAEIRDNDLKLFSLLDNTKNPLQCTINGTTKKSKTIIINYFFIPDELYIEHKNELVLEKESMKKMWAIGAAMNYTDKNNVKHPLNGISTEYEECYYIDMDKLINWYRTNR